jgi:hypothetical protein
MQLQVRIVKRTEKALLVTNADETLKAEWIPRSVVPYMRQVEVKSPLLSGSLLYVLNVDDWFVQKNPQLRELEI